MLDQKAEERWIWNGEGGGSAGRGDKRRAPWKEHCWKGARCSRADLASAEGLWFPAGAVITLHHSAASKEPAINSTLGGILVFGWKEAWLNKEKKEQRCWRQRPGALIVGDTGYTGKYTSKYIQQRALTSSGAFSPCWDAQPLQNSVSSTAEGVRDSRQHQVNSPD